jgi:cell division protein ZapA
MQTVTVSINGENYTIRTDDDPAYVNEVARYVDEKMREIASGGKVIATSKVAILTALNIADELFKSRKGHLERDRAAGRRIEKIILQLQGAVGD